MKIRAVFFDLGNTLVKMLMPEVILQSVLSSSGIDVSIRDSKDAVDRTEKDFRESGYRSKYGEVAYRDYWERWDASVLKYLGISESRISAREIAAKWFDHAGCSTYAEVVETLIRLKNIDIKLGMVSTAYEEDIDSILGKSGLSKDLFDVVVGVNTIRKEKPHPDVFRYALGRLGVRPDEALFVGDHIDSDYKGSRAVGIHALLIDREGRNIDDSSDVRRIKSLEEVFNFTG
jgi:HAD superfamily hydrolase (TIGR01549 family)